MGGDQLPVDHVLAGLAEQRIDVLISRQGGAVSPGRRLTGWWCAHIWRTTRVVSEIKTQRLHLRVAASDDELFRSAAAATQESLSEFLVESGRERAERVLADRIRFVLSASEWRAFTTALDRPARDVPAVVDLFRRARPE